MNPAIQKTISLVLLIGIGFLLQRKVTTPDQRKGVKTLILSIALPATIFVALLKIEFNLFLIYLPIFALLINGLLFVIIRYSLSLFDMDRFTADGKTVNLLFSSLAPGLSCFPFLVEYATEDALAFAALADVGNKVFVLVILYLVAMRWHYNTQQFTNLSAKSRLKRLSQTLIKEPVNLAIIVAIIMLYFGLNLSSLPAFLQEPITRMSLMMTPMILIFIGMAVKFNAAQMKKIGLLLIYRSACAFLISGLILIFLPQQVSISLLIVLVTFPQSAASFWPFAHISMINDMEFNKSKTFNIDLALNFLALSLPFSTVIILSICTFPEFFIEAQHSLLIGLLLIGLLLIAKFFQNIKARERTFELMEE